MRRPVRAGLTAAAALACTVMLGASVASASGGWVIQSTYAPPPSEANPKDIALQEVSCSAANACVTIGRAGSHQFLSESWNGTNWSPLLTPWPPEGGELGGVSCSAGSACTAVGFTSNSSLQSVPLVERWNGTSWQQQALSGPTGAAFSDVSCPAAQFCVAVGQHNTGPNTTATLAEAWNGTGWTVQPTPPGGRHAGFASLSCPTSSDCVAVGDNGTLSSGNVFIERWNGTSWAIQKSPQVPGKDLPELGSVSCATASSCIALGGYVTKTGGKALFEQWNGTSWVRQHVTVPEGMGFAQVSCPTATSCTAVGGTGAAHWNGTAWTFQHTTRPPHTLGDQELNALSCPTASVCEAVGFFHVKSNTGRFRDRTLIEAN
jgi:hypothetical protein